MAKEPSSEILQRGFVGFDGVAAEASENVGGDGAHLEADESGDQFVGARQNAHARGGEQNERVKFAALQMFLRRGSSSSRESPGSRPTITVTCRKMLNGSALIRSL